MRTCGCGRVGVWLCCCRVWLLGEVWLCGDVTLRVCAACRHLSQRKAMKERLRRGGVAVEADEDDHEDVFDGDDGMGRLDFEQVHCPLAQPESSTR